MLAFGFCRFSARVFRFLWGAVSLSAPCFLAGLFWALVLVALSPWGLLFLLVRRVCFVRFLSPSAASLGLVGRRGRRVPVRGRWRPPVPGLCCFASSWRSCWRVVPAACLPSLCASCVVWCVRPAVVRRRSGVVLLWWVCSPCFLEASTYGDDLRETAAVKERKTKLYIINIRSEIRCLGGAFPLDFFFRFCYNNVVATA